MAILWWKFPTYSCFFLRAFLKLINLLTSGTPKTGGQIHIVPLCEINFCSQLAMLSWQVCWSRGKRWRLIGQETIKDTRILGGFYFCLHFLLPMFLGDTIFFGARSMGPSVSNWLSGLVTCDITDVTLADEDTNSILTENANMTFQSNARQCKLKWKQIQSYS